MMPENAMVEKLTQFKFAYEVRFKGPRQRNWRYEYLACDGAFILRYADASEIDVAFRITRRYKEFPSAYEIVSFNKKLFWPIIRWDRYSFNSDEPWPNIDPDRHVTVGDFIDGIARGESDYLKVLHGASLPSAHGLRKSVDDLNARIDPRDRREEILIKSQRSGSQLLAYNDFIYLEGGEPVYLCQGRSSIHPWDKGSLDGIKVADSCSRWQNTYYGARGAGSYDDYVLDSRARAGEIFRADELANAERMIADHRAAIRQDDDIIEIVNCKEICTNPLDLHVEASISSLNFHIRREISKESPFFDGTAAIRKLEKQQCLGWEVGAAAIVEFIRWCELKQVDAGSELYNSFRRAIFEMDSLDRHCAQRGVAPKSRHDDVEDDAIAALAR